MIPTNFKVSPPEERTTRQPYEYRRRQIDEPDWRRLPGYAHVSRADWRDAKWQRRNSVTTLAELSNVFGSSLPVDLALSIEADTNRLATMGIRVTPHVLNTMYEHNLWHDPVRRYVLPAAADREPVWHTHPEAHRDSLHEVEMSVVEGLVWRYPTKALIELVSTCPVYCGHCTRMDLVGPDVPSVTKRRSRGRLNERLDAIISRLTNTPSIRDIVISGGDISNVPPELLEAFVIRMLAIGHIRSFRIATKAIIALPQHFLQASVLRVFERIARKARQANVEMAVHTHANHVESITPLVSEAAARLYDIGIPAIRNQGVLMRTVNASSTALLDLCFALLDEAHITPYYFYVCDLIPNGEHWRVPLHAAQAIQNQMMGYLPGFATPRIVCDVPYVGKRWVHQVEKYDRARGISTWRKNYWNSMESKKGDPMLDAYRYFDPVATLPPEGQAYWVQRQRNSTLINVNPHSRTPPHS
jgi:lysine 2,3-aminomutase